MSVRMEAQGRDINIAHKPYRITCTCEARFTFIEKDATVRHDPSTGFKELAINCPNCQRLCVTGHHENEAVREQLASRAEEKMAARGKPERPPQEEA